MNPARTASLCLAALLASGCDDPSPAARDAGFDAALDVTPDVTPDVGPPPTDRPLDADPPRDAGCTAAGTYAPGPFEIGFTLPLPDAAFTADDGHTVSLHDYYAPCAATPRLLVIRTFTAWSGPSRWYAAHTRALRSRPDAARLVVLDLLALNQSNLPASPGDLAAWRARYDAAPDTLAADPTYAYRATAIANPQPPIVMLVDTRTMRMIGIEPYPLSDQLDGRITDALARMDGRTPPRSTPPAAHDGRFTDGQWAMLQEMTPVPAPPADPTNAHADDPAAAALGRALFADRNLSPSGRFSCGGCHHPTQAFVDGRPTGVGAATGGRNTPSVLFSAHSRWQFWDGCADTLWAQALGPVENPGEMASSRLFVAHVIASQYASQYVPVFGALPALGDAARFPPDGHPGDAAWDAMAPADQLAVNRVFSNFGKAVAAYERSLRAQPGAFDRYVAGDAAALSATARDGLARWFEAGCVQCHYGPLLTDDSFHDVRMPTGRADGVADRGRIDAIAQLRASAFRSDGPYSDSDAGAPHLAGLAEDGAMLGQFHTPSLRGVAATGPWGHGGTFTTLDAVVRNYAQINMVVVPGTTGTADVHLGNFHTDDVYVHSLVEAMNAITAEPVTP